MLHESMRTATIPRVHASIACNGAYQPAHTGSTWHDRKRWPSCTDIRARTRCVMGAVGKRVVAAAIFVAFALQGASVAVQRLWMPEHYHVTPAPPDLGPLPRNATAALQAPRFDQISDPLHGHVHDDPAEEHHQNLDPGRYADLPVRRALGWSSHSPPRALGRTAHVAAAGSDKSDAGHGHERVSAHHHDGRDAGVVLVAGDGDTPASALIQRALDGFWSLLPDRSVFAVTTACDPPPALPSATHRLLANGAPERPPRV